MGIGANMFFTVDPSNGVPIYSQIVRQVKFAVAEQTLRPGQLLPSVRQLSQQLAVNPNTVARAFQDLQSEGVIETLRGRGVVVCKGAVERCRKQRQSILAERLSAVLTEALQAGLSAKEVRKLVDEQLRTLDGTIEAIAELQ
ncbi:Transcriptional regulator, GntR family [Rhodopirellula islandica]|uniref:Transcriptional regulator, GntR family n=2 Tax=Rhodopirellula islandica TaxID=595434 RepID=A0A0J1BDQ2_RHOIS|nr:Transcriptional regulator, GntR family [Rhodopirellula islandica]